jgi:hypothetical protein
VISPSPREVTSTAPPLAEDPEAAQVEPPQPLDNSVSVAPPTVLPPFADGAKGQAISTSPEPLHMEHDVDFAWVVGKLEYLNLKHQWRVRYAPCDVEDAYGGVVVLSGVDHLSGQLHDGDTVRVVGQLTPPANKKMSAEYFVHEIKTGE